MCSATMSYQEPESTHFKEEMSAKESVIELISHRFDSTPFHWCCTN